MKVGFWDDCPYYSGALRALAESLGHECVFGEPKGSLDFVVCSGWKRGLMCKWSGYKALVMDLGFFDPKRFSFGLEHPNGIKDGGIRSHPELKPWKTTDQRKALIVGQNTMKFSFGRYFFDFVRWVAEAVKSLRQRGYLIRYRPHPSDPFVPSGVEVSKKELKDDLNTSDLVVTLRSTVGITSILSGVPVIATDPWALCYEVSANTFNAPIVRPDRTKWVERLSWGEWDLEELENGSFWRHWLPQLETV